MNTLADPDMAASTTRPIWLYIAGLILALLALAATVITIISFQKQAERERLELEAAYRRHIDVAVAAWDEVARTYPSGSGSISEADWQAFVDAVDAYGLAARDLAAITAPPGYETFQAHLAETMNACYDVLSLIAHTDGNPLALVMASPTIMDKANTCRIMRDRLDWESLTVH